MDFGKECSTPLPHTTPLHPNQHTHPPSQVLAHRVTDCIANGSQSWNLHHGKLTGGIVYSKMVLQPLLLYILSLPTQTELQSSIYLCSTL